MEMSRYLFTAVHELVAALLRERRSDAARRLDKARVERATAAGTWSSGNIQVMRNEEVDVPRGSAPASASADSPARTLA